MNNVEFIYDINEMGQAEITEIIIAKLNEGEEIDLYIPNVIDSYQVNSIKRNALNAQQVRTITIEEGVEILAEGAFYYSNAKKVHLPNSLRFIGKYAFAKSSLSSIIIPPNVSFVGEYAFEGVMEVYNLASTDLNIRQFGNYRNRIPLKIYNLNKESKFEINLENTAFEDDLRESNAYQQLVYYYGRTNPSFIIPNSKEEFIAHKSVSISSLLNTLTCEVYEFLKERGLPLKYSHQTNQLFIKKNNLFEEYMEELFIDIQEVIEINQSTVIDNQNSTPSNQLYNYESNNHQENFYNLNNVVPSIEHYNNYQREMSQNFQETDLITHSIDNVMDEISIEQPTYEECLTYQNYENVPGQPETTNLENENNRKKKEKKTSSKEKIKKLKESFEKQKEIVDKESNADSIFGAIKNFIALARA